MYPETAHNFNGHMSPYVPYQNQPNRGVPGESSSSSEEGSRPQGQAWAVPPTSQRTITETPTDRRNYGRTSDSFGSGSENKWSVPSQTLQGTWRGLGTGFEQRPSYTNRSNTTHEGTAV